MIAFGHGRHGTLGPIGFRRGGTCLRYIRLGLYSGYALGMTVFQRRPDLANLFFILRVLLFFISGFEGVIIRRIGGHAPLLGGSSIR